MPAKKSGPRVCVCFAEMRREAELAQAFDAAVDALGLAKEAGEMTLMPAPGVNGGQFQKRPGLRLVIRTMPRRER